MQNRRAALVFIFILASVMLVSFSASAQQKQIKDQAEYAAYMAAYGEPDPAKKAAAMDAFVQQYPQSIVKVEALEMAMAGYQQSGNTAKVVATAKRILEVVPNSIRPMAIIAAVDRARATAGDRPALDEGCAYARTGSQQLSGWQKPEEMSDADFAKLRSSMEDIFEGALGFCALQAKNYSAARDAYTKAYQLDPTSLQDLYQLAVADLEMNPIDVSGLWYCAKAMNLAGKSSPAAVNSIAVYCKAKYKRYHGGEDGWDQLVTGGASQSALPVGFAIKPAPTPADLAVQAVQENKPEDLSFSDKEFILGYHDASPANADAADKVWASIQTMQKNGAARLEIPMKVISADANSIDGAISDDNQAANKPDVHVIMEKPMANPPPANAAIKVIGLITSYTPRPFMFTMEHGELSTLK